MFWTSSYVSSPQIEALLNKKDVTLQELMDQEDILQECKTQNKKLVEYLTKPEVMEELVNLTTKEPSTEVEERWRYKYPNVACELLTCDVPTLNEKLAGNESLLSKLYSFIDTDQPLNPLLASFFSRTIGVLIARKSDQVFEFLKSRQRCVDMLLQHLETSAIMDLVFKLATQVEGADMRQNILNWLDSQNLVQRLVKLLSPSSDATRHGNAAELLGDIFRVARETRATSTERTDPDPILNTLESAETVSLLLETILTGEKLESSIVGGIQVLLALLTQRTNNPMLEGEVHGNTAEDDAAFHEQCIKISNATIPYLEQLHELLLNPPHKPSVKTTAGTLDCPLGNTRIHVAKLLVSLLATENFKIHEKLADLGTFQTLLDLFFKYSWNNFLHTQVQHCLALAIQSECQDNNDIIYSNLFMKCRLIERILEAWEKNDSKQSKKNGVRQGYMGHLIIIANNIVAQCEKNNLLDTFLKTQLPSETLSKWENLINKELFEINKTQQIVLGGQKQVYSNSTDEDIEAFNSCTRNAYAQQVYANYQGQQMTSQFIENFGYHDDEFNDGEDALHNSVDQLTTVAFTLSEEDLDKGEDMFNKVCQQKQKAGLEESGGAVEWGDEGELTFQTVVEKRDWPSKQQHHDSSSSDDDDEDPRDMHMDIDANDPWDSTEPLPNNAVLPEVNPWDIVPSEPVESTGWANFDNFDRSSTVESSSKIDNKFEEEPKEENTGGFTEQVKATENKTENETTKDGDGGGGGGDTNRKLDANETIITTTTSTPGTNALETNLNSKDNDENIFSVNTSDTNANPSEATVAKREGESADDTKSPQELTTIPVPNVTENEKTALEINTSSASNNSQ